MKYFLQIVIATVAISDIVEWSKTLKYLLVKPLLHIKSTKDYADTS